MSHLSNVPVFNHPYDIWRRAQIRKFLIVYFSPPCYSCLGPALVFVILVYILFNFISLVESENQII